MHIVTLCSAILNLLLASSVISLSSSSALASDSSKESRIIRLGMVAPLTGDFLAYGNHIKEGVQLAAEDLKAAGVHTAISYEDGCLPAQVRTALTKMITLDRIDGLVGSYCVVGLFPSASLIESSKIVALHTSTVPVSLLNASNYIFSTNNRAEEEAEKLAEYAYNKLGAKRAGIIYFATAWGEGYQAAFAKYFEKLGGTIVSSDLAAVGVNDFRPELTKLKIKNPDVIFSVHVGPGLGTILRQARSMGFKQQFITVNEAEEQDVIDVAKGSAEGLMFLAPEPENATDEMSSFEAEFESKFQRLAHPLARHSYDATMLLGKALHECGGDHECSKAKVQSTRNYSGASGEFSIDSDRGTTRTYVLKTVRDGKFVRAAGR